MFVTLPMMNNVLKGYETRKRNGARANETTVEPRYHTAQNEKGYTLELEVPGVAEDHIDVTLKDDVLRVKAEYKKTEHAVTEEGKEETVEKTYRTYEISFAFPEDADSDAIEAAYTNGILTLHIPYHVEAHVEKKIAITK